MALSDYLTGDEWDACWYAFFGKHLAPNFGESMHMTIQALLKSGYVFPGLDDNGNKKEQICDGINAPKFSGMFFHTLSKEEKIQIFDNGRNFLKEHLPSLINETDEEWQEIINETKG